MCDIPKEYALWVQREFVEGENLLSYNGEIVTKDDCRYSNIYTKCFSENGYEKFLSKDLLTVFQKNTDKGKTYIIQSCFKDKDKEGRNYAYQFYVDRVKSLPEAYKQLRYVATKYGYSVRQTDINDVNEEITRRMKNRRWSFLGGMVFLLIISISIVKCSQY